MAVEAARPDVSIARPISRADPIANSTEMSRLARAFDGAAVGHDHRAGRNPRRMHHRHAGERFERGRDGHCREEAEARSRRGGAERKKTAKLPASWGLVFHTRYSTCRGQRRHTTNSPWAGDLSILNKDGDAATEVQRLARASDDGNRWRAELPHDLRTGCPDWGQARHKSPLSRNENLSRKEARKDSPSRNDALPRSYNLAWKEDLSGNDDLGNRAATEYEATETWRYSESAGVHNEGHLSCRKTKRG